MTSLSVACVWTGTKYGVEYVTRLCAMVARHLPRPHDFVCVTDHRGHAPHGWPLGVRRMDISHLSLPGWWGKMALFDPAVRGPGRTLYLDLDTVVVGDLAPLADWHGDFGICRNFTQLAGHPTWPSRYGSCAMVFGPGWGEHVWCTFRARQRAIMLECPKGDQQAIEALMPEAVMLQEILPPGFFLHYRDLVAHPTAPSPGVAVVVFGGRRTPGNFGPPWVRRAWAASPKEAAA